MSKAYDHIEWSFLEKMLLKLGFHENWVQLIMNCVSTVTYRIKVNGELTEDIIPNWGITQGDPLSPYLFLICAEAFSCLLGVAEGSGDLLCLRKDKGGLGYRDLHLFNLAMLARQGWQLLLSLESLCAQVLRSKYYPDGDLLPVVEKLGISYSWRSIIRGVQALTNGLVWRVGDGTHINIWMDPWIPQGVTRRLITPRGHTILNKVSDLIDPISGEWDVSLINDFFGRKM